MCRLFYVLLCRFDAFAKQRLCRLLRFPNCRKFAFAAASGKVPPWKSDASQREDSHFLEKPLNWVQGLEGIGENERHPFAVISSNCSVSLLKKPENSIMQGTSSDSLTWYQTAARWALLGAVAIFGIGYLGQGLIGKSNQDEAITASLDLGLQRSSDIAAVVEDVNAEFRNVWQRDEVEFAEPADWQTISRRISLALLGSGVSLEDMRWLADQPEADRTSLLLERLLADRRFADYWGERFARSYVGADEGPFLVFRRRRFVNWLSSELHSGKPYNEIVHSLIAAKGIWTENPAVNFLTVTIDSGEEGRPDPIRLAARTSRAFLGMRIDCVQCHDDFLGNVTMGTESKPEEGTQEHFHGLAAFYASSANSIQGIRNDGKPYKYQFLYEDEEREVPPQVPFLKHLFQTDEEVDVEVVNDELRDGQATEDEKSTDEQSEDESRQGKDKQDRERARKDRLRLANWVTHPENMPAARAVVNRVWALMFGKPLSEPVDDIPLHGPFPPGLDRLAHDFSEHNWDLRRLIRIIANLQVFQVDSRTDSFEVAKRHENAWAVFPLIRLRPEQVAACIVQACRLDTIDRDSSFLAQFQMFGDINDFVTRYGDTGEDEFDQDSVTITQRLLAMNGKLMRERTTDNPFANAAAQIAMFAEDDAHAIETAYLAAFNRDVTSHERQLWLEAAKKENNRQRFLEDMYWALLNGSEFTWNH